MAKQHLLSKAPLQKGCKNLCRSLEERRKRGSRSVCIVEQFFRPSAKVQETKKISHTVVSKFRVSDLTK